MVFQSTRKEAGEAEPQKKAYRQPGTRDDTFVPTGIRAKHTDFRFLFGDGPKRVYDDRNPKEAARNTDQLILYAHAVTSNRERFQLLYQVGQAVWLFS